MGKFTVIGGVPLIGSVRVSGSKNAALPIIFASVTTRGVSRFYNLPNITDVRDALGIIKDLGAKIHTEAGITLIDTRDLNYSPANPERVAKIRASTYLIGSSLARFGRAELLPFGGCAFSHRPIDMHLDAAAKFGAKIDGTTLTVDTLRAADISFRQPSVGATVNALIMAASTKGESHIVGAAREPHIQALISYLRSAGAEITVDGSSYTVKGAELHGGMAVIPGDMIEAGTFIAASMVTDGAVSVSGFDTRELSAFTTPLLSHGVIEQVTDSGIILRGRPRREISVTTGAYPAFATDLQPIFSTVLATSHGGEITDAVWPSRFGYLDELAKFGLSYSRDGNKARIFRSEIRPASVVATDLRGGAAAIILSLLAVGKSEISSGETVLRGYDSLVEKLKNIGADIRYE